MKPLNILVFRDNAVDVEKLRQMFSEDYEEPFCLKIADNIDEGIQIISQGEIDIILMDLTLSKPLELEKFKKIYNTNQNIPVVILTGLYDKDTAIKALSIGAQDYLPPQNLSSELLCRTIRYALERNRIRLQLREALDNIKILKGLLPICIKCKKVHDEEGYWQRIEAYFEQRSELEFFQCLCSDCIREARKK
ncbi:MAG: response regulator [Candidatus Eremiobacterota bacterium]